MKNKIIPTLIAALVAISFTACKENSTNPPSSGGTTDFTYGMPKTYSVSAGTNVRIADTISGSVFVFPNGGSGTLTVTPIKTSPISAPVSGVGYRVEYSGTDSLEISIAHQPDELALMYVWSTPTGSVYENRTTDANWIAIEPTDSISSPSVFPLVEPGIPSASGAKNPIPMFIQRPYEIWQSTIKKSSNIVEQLSVLTELAKTCILSIYNALPTSVQPAARAEIDGRLAPKVHFAYPGMISLYHPFVIGSGIGGSWTRTADPYFMFQVIGSNAATSSTVAHEVGHYMSHVLTGDDNMATLESQANKYHEMGDAHSGRPMLEEYAMFADYFMWGKAGGSNNMEEPINLLNLIKSYTPAQVDWPSREGYATCLLAVLHAGKSKLLVGLSGAAEDIPVIKAPFTSEWAMLADKPMNVNALRAEVALYLNSVGRSDAMPVILERTGWSYHGTGTLLIAPGQPLVGAKVQNVVTVASEQRDYYTGTMQATTDKDGNFTLDRICPGNSVVRVWVGKDSIDLGISVDANSPTSTPVTLGALTVGQQSDTYIMDQFTSIVDSGIFEEPYDLNVIVPVLNRMPTAKVLKIGLGYYFSAGNRSAYLYADDSTDLAIGTDMTSYATDVLNLYQFTGTLTAGSLHAREVTGAVGTEQLAMGWFETNVTLSGNTITGTVSYTGRRYVPDPNDPNSGKVVLQSEGKKMYSLHGTRQ